MSVVISKAIMRRKERNNPKFKVRTFECKNQIIFLFYLTSPGVAEAVLYSPDTKVPRTGEVALRRAIPANANMKAIQVCFINTMFG